MGLAVYVHIPFCVNKCNYCDFPSYPVAGMDVQEYLEAIGVEMEMYREEVAGREISTLYIGGGTPSILSGAQLQFFFSLIESRFSLETGAEVSFEANPGTVSLEKLELLKALGVNRLSLGVQSLNEGLLRRLGRIHTPEQAVQAYELARRAGFANINLDLMHGLPGQAEETWEDTLRAVVDLKPEHLSAYGLIIEEGTAFGREWLEGSLVIPDEEIRAGMFRRTRESLISHGYNHYEISNYALPGRECRHNKVYWRNEPYLGFGAGAASYWQGMRRTNHADVKRYLDDLKTGRRPEADAEKPDTHQQMAETMFLGLRLLEGVECSRFAERFAQELERVYGSQINSLVSKGLLARDSLAVKLTEDGMLLANEVFCEFLP